MSFEAPTIVITRGDIENPRLRGLYRDPEGSWRFDLRLTAEAVAASPWGPRSADLDLAGPDTVPVTDALITELDLDR